MARKRQAPPPLDADGIWKAVFFYGLIQVPVEIDLSMAVHDFHTHISAKMQRKPEGTEETIDDIRIKVRAIMTGVEIFREILAMEIQGRLRFAIKEAVEISSRRALVEGARRGAFTRKLIHQGRGRKPGSKESPKVTARKVEQCISEMEAAARRIADRKAATWSWSALAREMGKTRQALREFASAHPEVLRTAEEIIYGCKN